MLKKNLNFKSIYINSDINIFIYIENNIIFITSLLGILKLKFPIFLIIYKDLNIINIKKSYEYIITKKKRSNNILNYTIIKIGTLLKNLTIGYNIKFKIIGLGHKVLYAKNNFFFKLGYSHLIYCFLPIFINSKKKKKKKKFIKLISINNIKLLNFFFYIIKLRIPDIFSMNGIFNRNDFIQFKQGKKSFLL